jgi:HlyD family secretion protein
VENENRVVGQLESDRVELTSEFAEPIVERLIREGDTVTAGQLLLRQDDARIMARIAEANATLSQNRARLDELIRGPREEQILAARANVEGAEQDLAFRQIEYKRAVEVYERQLASTEARDRAKASLDTARANLRLHEARLSELLTGTTIEEMRQAESVVQQSEARIDLLEVEQSRHQFVAPVDGIVDSILFEIGERPGLGQPVIIMLAGPQPYARVYVPEEMRVSIGPGTNAQVHVDGLEQPLDGRVRWVASEAAFTPYFALTERDRGRLTYFAKVDILTERVRLPDGVPVDIEFLSNAARD